MQEQLKTSEMTLYQEVCANIKGVFKMSIEPIVEVKNASYGLDAQKEKARTGYT